MKYLKIAMLLVGNLYTSGLFCQSIHTDGMGNITNLSEAKSQKIIDEVRFDEGANNVRLPYSRIKGSPFWKDEFLPAKIYASTGQVYSAAIRLNLVTNEIHFLKNDEEMVLLELSIDKIVLYTGKDSALFLGKIANLVTNSKRENGFVQVLNTGKFQLMKYTKRTVASADSLFHTQKRYFFSDETSYFLRSNEKIEKIKRLTRDNLFKLLPSALPYDDWLDENKIDPKKEDDVVRFLNHYNSTRTATEN